MVSSPDMRDSARTLWEVQAGALRLGAWLGVLLLARTFAACEDAPLPPQDDPRVRFRAAVAGAPGGAFLSVWGDPRGRRASELSELCVGVRGNARHPRRAASHFAEGPCCPHAGGAPAQIQRWIVRSAVTANRNLVPFYTAWGFPITAETRAATASLPVWAEDPMR